MSATSMNRAGIIRHLALLILGTLASTDGLAANGQCAWEGGPGVIVYPQCQAEDCVDAGGAAWCAEPEIVPPNSATYDQVDAAMFQYGGCSVGWGGMPVANGRFCSASGGTWNGNSAPVPCSDLPPDAITPYIWRSESFMESVMDKVAAAGLGSNLCEGPDLQSDSGWGFTGDGGGCWSNTNVIRNGHPIHQLREFIYSGVRKNSDGTCPGIALTDRFIARRDRGLRCPEGYDTRTLPNGDMQCWQSADANACPMGNPTFPLSGVKIETVTDYEAGGIGGLRLTRHYRSRGYFRLEGEASRPYGADYWRHNYEASLHPVTGSDFVMAVARRPDGLLRHFDLAGEEVLNRDGTGYRLEHLPGGGGWTLTTSNEDREHYDETGRLEWIEFRGGLRINMSYNGLGQLEAATDAFGKSIIFLYGSDKLLDQIVLPDNGLITYAHDANGMLESVTYQDQSMVRYHYEDTARWHLLTGITDANGSRYSTYSYDAKQRVTVSTHQGNTNRFVFSYTGENQTKITDPLGTQRTYNFQLQGGVKKLSSLSQPCSSCGGSAQGIGYDANGNVSYRTDFNGHRTNYQFDPIRNLETSRTEGLAANGATTAATRAISTTWHPMLRLPATVTRPSGLPGVDLVTSYQYDPRGNVISRTESAGGVSSSWSYAYDALGRLLTADGPRTDVVDVTSYTYYSDLDPCIGCRGQMQTVTNALGQVTSFDQYDLNGRILRQTDVNGVQTRFTYDDRGRLTETVRGFGTPAEATTRMAYDDVGQLVRLTSPIGGWMEYDYDAAHRLVSVEDSLGNRIEYTLDPDGNRLEERTFDPQGELRRSLRREVDALGRVRREVHGADQVHTHQYDAEGNRVASLDPEQRLGQSRYDELDRLIESIDPAGHSIGYEYDSADRLVEVTDPNGLTTRYGYDGLGRLVELDSPDTGVQTHEYDEAGNRIRSVDARLVVTEYGYDALGRLLWIDYEGKDVDVGFEYDDYGTSGSPCAASYPVGRLARMTDGSGSTTYCYDALGALTEKNQLVGSDAYVVKYGRDASGQVTRLDYPSGTRVDYARDVEGRVRSLSVAVLGGASDLFIADVEYLPFGPLSRIAFASGDEQQRTFDDAYRVLAINAGSGALTGEVRRYRYDALSRLVAAEDESGRVLDEYGYDPTGNRLTHRSRAGTSQYSFATGSHRLEAVGGVSRTYDAAGNTTGREDGLEFVYGYHNRLTEVWDGASLLRKNVYNGRGERMFKGHPSEPGPGGSPSWRYVYDEGGVLLAESRRNGLQHRSLQDHIWLDRQPVGLVTHSGAFAGEKLAVVGDHLGTSRRVIALEQRTDVWEWPLEGEAFGSGAVLDDPDGDGVALDYDLRFPGQHADDAIKTFYNYFRDYEPMLGRYVESDPIGFAGGINTYAYVGARPLFFYDFLGLMPGGPSCCDPFRKQVLAQGNGGTVVCCGGKNVYCVFGDYSDAPFMYDCIEEHEKTHLNDVKECKPCDTPKLSRFKGGALATVVQRQSECRAYIRDANCIGRNAGTCGSNQRCSDYVRRRLEAVRDQRAFNCSAAGAPLITQGGF